MEFDFGNVFDECQETNTEKLQELFSKINQADNQFAKAYLSAMRDLFEKAFKFLLSQLIVGDDSLNKKKLWFREKFFEKITHQIIDDLFERYAKYNSKTVQRAIDMTFDSILKSDDHKYYINGGITALEQGIRLDMSSVILEKVDSKNYEAIFPGISESAKQIFAPSEKSYNQMMKNHKIDEEFSKNKSAIIYQRFHNIDTLPRVSCYFDIIECEKSFEEIIEADNVDMLRAFDEKNPFVIYSNKVFNFCAENFAKECFMFFYNLITPEERILEEKFLKHAIHNLNNDPVLNYAGVPFYKTSTKCQVITKGPDEKSIMFHNRSIIYESVFLSAFTSGIDNGNMKSAIEMINMMKKLQIVVSDVTKYGFSSVGGPVSAYTSIIVTYLNSNFKS